MSINTTNPYLNHPQLTPLESEVLWEYAKLADKVKRITVLSRETVDKPNSKLLEELRELEKEMKLVLTMYQAAVWNVQQADDMRVAEAEAREMQEHEYSDEHSGDDGHSTMRAEDSGDGTTIMY